MSDVLGGLYSYIDGRRRALVDALKNPSDAFNQFVGQLGDQNNENSVLTHNAGYGLIDKPFVSVLADQRPSIGYSEQSAVSPSQQELARALLSERATQSAMAGMTSIAGSGKLADALIKMQESPAFAKLRPLEKQSAVTSLTQSFSGDAIPRTSGNIRSAVGNEEDIGRSLMNLPAFKVSGQIPKSTVDNAVGNRALYRAEPPTTPGAGASEKDWADWGSHYGVNMTRTPNQALLDSSGKPLIDGRTGNPISIPGGLDGTFTIPDLLHIKANNFDPNFLPQDVHNSLMKKFMRTHTPANPDQVDMFNQLNFALLSPNAPLTQNEFLQARARLTNMDELKALAGRVGEPGLSSTAAQQLGVGGAGASGGMGVLGTADLGNQAMLAKLILDKPEMFQIGPGETMRDVTMRVMNQVPGLGPKTASLGTPWLDLNNANTSAVDLHMIRNNYPRMLTDPDVGEAFTNRMSGLLKVNPDPAAILAHPDAEEKAISVIGGTDVSRKYRLKDGSLNNIPPSATPDRLAYEPESMRDFNPFYSKVVDYVDQSRGANPEIPLFPEQWRLWDRYRQRVEPHEFAHPDFRLLPKQSWTEMQGALQAHKDAGYTQSINPVMNPSDWRSLYYGNATVPMLGMTAAGAAGAAYGLNQYGNGQ